MWALKGLKNYQYHQKFSLRAWFFCALAAPAASILFTGAATGIFLLTPLISILITISSVLSTLLLLAMGVNYIIMSYHTHNDPSLIQKTKEAATRKITEHTDKSLIKEKEIGQEIDKEVREEIPDGKHIKKAARNKKCKLFVMGVLLCLLSGLFPFSTAYALTGTALFAFLPTLLISAISLLIITPLYIALVTYYIEEKSMWEGIKFFLYCFLPFFAGLSPVFSEVIHTTYAAMVVGAYVASIATFVLTIVLIGIGLVFGFIWLMSSYDGGEPPTSEIKIPLPAQTYDANLNQAPHLHRLNSNESKHQPSTLEEEDKSKAYLETI